MTYCTGTTLDMDIHKNESPKVGPIDENAIPNLYTAAKKKKLNQVHFFEFFADENIRNRASNQTVRRSIQESNNVDDHLMMSEADTQVETLINKITKPHDHIKVLNYE